MFRNVHNDKDCEEIKEHEVSEAKRAWQEYRCAVQRTEEICGLKIENGTRLEVLSLQTRGEARWRKGTLGVLSSDSNELNSPLCQFKFDDGHMVIRVASMAPNIMQSMVRGQQKTTRA